MSINTVPVTSVHAGKYWTEYTTEELDELSTAAVTSSTSSQLCCHRPASLQALTPNAEHGGARVLP